MNKFKKILNAVAISSILLVPAALNANAISHSSDGSLSNAQFNGQWYTVAMNNYNGSLSGGTVNIDNWGSGNGNVKLGMYVSTRYGVRSHYSTFSTTGSTTWNIVDGYSGIWGVDGTCTKTTKYRYADVSWKLT